MLDQNTLSQCKAELFMLLNETEVIQMKSKATKNIETLTYLVPALFLAMVFISIVLR